MSRPTLPPALLSRLHRLRWLPQLRLLVFGALYVAAAAGAVHLAGLLPPAGWLLLVPLYALAAACLHGISLFTHEGVHNALSRSRPLNHVLAALCALPVLQSFAGYRVLHLRHHAYLGRPGDPDHYPNLTAHPRRLQLLYVLRLVIGYPIYVVALPLLGWRKGNRADRVAIAAELVLLAGVVAALLVWGPGGHVWLHAWLFPMLFVHFGVNLRGMSQHTLLEPADHPVYGSRSILSGPLLRYFLCNENYHLEHHLYPAVPWYHLPELHAALRPELEEQGAPLIPGYLSFLWAFLRKPEPERRPIHA